MRVPTASDLSPYDVSGDATPVATPVATGSREPDARGGTSTIGTGSVVGRHMVLQKLGAGGMGVVYAAYDPELDRKIALKLLLPGRGGANARLRLLREAQALARLSHPNVVAIHDVGTVGEQVWIAMEFVQGQTLARWLATPRGWREVLAVLRSAGAGLAAAHAAGLLHRDFKPDNVMIGDDGRVCVMDLGLAREHANGRSFPGEREPPRPRLQPSGALATSVTRVDAIVGTPGYMAPEQLERAELTAAADQFAFCVTLWSALYGEAPFGGRTVAELFTHVLGGKPAAPPRGRAVPSWLRRACERGLRVEPTERWPTMDALLDTLAKGHARARARKGLAAVGLLALLGAGVDVQRRYRDAERAAACEASGAAVESAWNGERKQALRDALVATGASFAAETADATMPWLDRHAETWRAARVEACLDAELRDRWTPDMLERSLWCLDERHAELASLVDELTLADAAVVQKSVMAAAHLTSVAPCRDERVLRALAPPPSEDREAVRAVRADVARAGTLEKAGRYAKGLALAHDAFARAQALRWPPLLAAAGLQLGSLQERAGAYADAEATLEEAYFEAAEGVAPEVHFEAAAELVFLVGVDAARHADGRRWGRLAEVALGSLPDDEGLRRARLLTRLATIHDITGAHDEARQQNARALAIQEHALGPDHPDVALVLTNLAIIHNATGAHEDAKALLTRALAIREQALGPTHPDVAMSLNNLGVLHKHIDEHGAARDFYERALAIKQQALGPTHPDVAMSLNNLGAVLQALGELEEARTLHIEALAIRERTLGPDHPHVAMSLFNLGRIAEDSGALEDALGLYERTRAIQEKVLGPEHPDVAETFTCLARIALGQHRPVDAVRLAQRALRIGEERGIPAPRQALAGLVLARALYDAPEDEGRDRTRAVSLAAQARDAFREAGRGHADDLAEAEAWLAAHADAP